MEPSPWNREGAKYPREESSAIPKPVLACQFGRVEGLLNVLPQQRPRRQHLANRSA